MEKFYPFPVPMLPTVHNPRAAQDAFLATIEQQRKQITALKNRLAGTESENGLLDTRCQNLQTDMEVLEKERDSLLFGLEEWMEKR